MRQLPLSQVDQTRNSGALICVALALLQLLGSGCAGAPANYDREATRLGMERRNLSGHGFTHATYRDSDKNQADTPLHVYLYGDGRPWLRRHIPSPDPTPRTPLMLQLMALDPNPSLLLGRPCYHGYARAPGCDRRLWTSHRYGETVLASMLEVLRQANPDRHPLLLIGHSGGGALAMLMAPRLTEVIGVVTLAANLDIDAWSRHRRISPLVGSLNPVREVSGWCPACVHLHLAGGDDEHLPAALINDALAAMGEPPAQVLPGVTHDAGWLRHWPDVLRKLK